MKADETIDKQIIEDVKGWMKEGKEMIIPVVNDYVMIEEKNKNEAQPFRPYYITEPGIRTHRFR